MSWFSRFTERIKRLFRRNVPEVEIPIEAPEIEKPEISIVPEEQIPISTEAEKEIEVPPELEQVPEKEELLSKVVTFEERIRGTRIKRTVERVYPMDTGDGEIHKILDSQYDNGGNYVLNVKNIEVKANPGYEENEIDRGMPGSADVSP